MAMGTKTTRYVPRAILTCSMRLGSYVRIKTLNMENIDLCRNSGGDILLKVPFQEAPHPLFTLRGETNLIFALEQQRQQHAVQGVVATDDTVPWATTATVNSDSSYGSPCVVTPRMAGTCAKASQETQRRASEGGRKTMATQCANWSRSGSLSLCSIYCHMGHHFHPHPS
jgi:hypothetical protein